MVFVLVAGLYKVYSLKSRFSKVPLRWVLAFFKNPVLTWLSKQELNSYANSVPDVAAELLLGLGIVFLPCLFLGEQ